MKRCTCTSGRNRTNRPVTNNCTDGRNLNCSANGNFITGININRFPNSNCCTGSGMVYKSLTDR